MVNVLLAGDSDQLAADGERQITKKLVFTPLTKLMEAHIIELLAENFHVHRWQLLELTPSVSSSSNALFSKAPKPDS
jgi:hypothetical protein